MAPPSRKPLPAAASKEDTSSGDDRELVQHRYRVAPIQPPAHQESDDEEEQDSESKLPEPKGPAGAEDEQADDNLQEKKKRYPYLWEEIQALGVKHRMLKIFEDRFLKVTDEEATKLNTKIEEQRKDEEKLAKKYADFEKDLRQ